MLVCSHPANFPSASAMSTAAPYKCDDPIAFGLILCWSLIDRKQDVARIGGLYPSAFIFLHKSSRFRRVMLSTSLSFQR